MGQHVENNRRAAKMRNPVLDNELEDLSRVDLAKTQLRAAGSDHRPRIGPPGAMEHRECPKKRAVDRKPEVEAVAKRRQVSAAMTVDNAFWIAGCAGRVEEAERLPFIGDARPVEAWIRCVKEIDCRCWG